MASRGQPGHTGGASSIAWRAVLPAFFATTAGILPGFLNAALAVQIRDELGLSLTELGVLIGIFFAIAGIVSPAAGRWSEKRGWATALRTSVVLVTVSLIGIAWLAHGMPVLATFLSIGGVGSSLGQVSSNLAIARGVAGQRQGLVFGLRHASVPAAAALAGAAVPGIALTVGWRWAFVGAALLAIGSGLAIPLREEPHTLNRPAARNGGRSKPPTPARLLIVLSVAVGVGIAGIDGFTAFLVSYAADSGVTETAAGLLLTIGSITGMISRLIVGWMIDHIPDKDLTTIATMMFIGAGGVILLILGGRPGLFLGGLVVFAAGWGWSGLFTFAIVKDNPEAPAAASGVTQVGKYFGAAAGPPLFGFLADHVSFHVAHWFTAFALTLAAFLILQVRKQRTNV
jgi:cyanate permease